MRIEDLIVSAEDIQTGERVIGYVCGCKSCRTAFEHEKYDHNRPIGLLTHPEELYGNVRVYTDNMELVKDITKNKFQSITDEKLLHRLDEIDVALKDYHISAYKYDLLETEKDDITKELKNRGYFSEIER